MDLKYYTTKIDFFFDTISSCNDKFNLHVVNSEKELFRILLNDINATSNSYTIIGAIVPRDMLLMWYLSFKYLKDTYYNENNVEEWKEIMNIMIGAFNSMFNNPHYFNQEKISDAKYEDRLLPLFLSTKTTIHYLCITCELIILLSMGINIFSEDLSLINSLSEYINSKIFDKLDFQNHIKILR